MDPKTKSTARRERRSRELDRAAKLRGRVDAQAILDRLQDIALGRDSASKEEMDALKFLATKVVPNITDQAPASEDGPGKGNVFVISWSGQPIPGLKHIKGVVMDESGLLIEDKSDGSK
jgi:hypothetical protein